MTTVNIKTRWSQHAHKYYKGKKDNYSKTAIYVLLGAVLLVTALSYYGYSEDSLSVSTDGLEIEGMYGVDLAADEIAQIELVESLPVIRSRVHGISMSTRFKGYFRTEDFQKIKLVVNENKGPFILIQTTEGLEIYYSATSGKTQETFDQIESTFPDKIQ